MTPNKFGKILDKLPKDKTELAKIEIQNVLNLFRND